MSDAQDRDFFWVTNAEPHYTRRRQILAKYGPQVRKLYGTDISTAWQVAAVTLLQVACAVLLWNAAWWKVFLAAYTIGGTLSQNLFTAQHELSHFLAFRKPIYNRILSLVSNCPLVVPMAAEFRKYHQEHHSHLGVDGWDVDLPTYLEANYVCTTLTKTLWVLVYIAVYGLRPIIIRPKKAGAPELLNIGLVVGFDLALLYFCGIKPLVYLLAGVVLGGGLHPLGGHLIAEHYMFLKGQETYSYYGPLNALTYNVGFHNEHHDFPQIPHTRLHKLRDIAPEFYMTLQHHTSWSYVTWMFLTDPEVGPWTRMRRQDRGHGQEVVAVAKPVVPKEQVPLARPSYDKPTHEAGVLGKAGQSLHELTARTSGSRAAGLIT